MRESSSEVTFETAKRDCLALLPDPGDKLWDDVWGTGEVRKVFPLTRTRGTLVIARFGNALFGYGSYQWWQKLKAKRIKLL